MPTSVVFALPPPLGVCGFPKYKWDRWYLPSSLFKFGNLRMYMASFMPRARSSLCFSTIFALSKSMTWYSFTAWSVRAEPHSSLCDCLFLSLVYTVVSLTFSASDRCSLMYFYQTNKPLQELVINSIDGRH